MSTSGLIAAATSRTPPTARPRPPQRRRWWLVGGGLAILAGSLAGVQVYVVAQNQTTPVLALARDVGWGHQLTEEDLVVAAAVPDAHLQTIAAGDRAQVVGQVAAHTLAAGTLLTRPELTTVRVPAAGELVVGVLLKPGGLPATGVRPEDRVLLTPTTASGSTGTAEVPSAQGVVLDAGAPSSDGSVVVDVVIEGSQAAIAGPAGAGQVVLSLEGR
jgi:hypothetical protein